MNLCESVVIILGLALFLGLAGYQLTLPGPHYDEAIELLPTMQMVLGQKVEAFRGAGVQIGGAFFPVMVMDYIGAMNTYLALPFFAIFGVDVVAMRLLPIGVAALALLLTYGFARELLGRAAAAIAFLTLAGNISFVFWSRQGIFVTNLTATLMLGMLWCALRWWRGRRRSALLATAFLAGLGLYAKFIFLWAILALLGAAILLNLDRLWATSRRFSTCGRLPTWRDLALAALAFCLPLAPLIVFNVQTAGGTLRNFSRNLVSSYYGVNNLDFLANLATRLDQLKTVLEGSHFWYLGETFANRLWLPALLGALALLFALAILGRGWTRTNADEDSHILSPRSSALVRVPSSPSLRAALLPYVMIALIVVQSCFTISALWFTHYAILTPLPALALAGALAFIVRRSGRPRLLWPAAILLIATIVGSDLLADVRYHTVLSASGGYAAHSDASYELARTLETAGDPVVALDWGIQAQVQLLTRGRVAPVELFGYDSLDAPDAGYVGRLQPHLQQPQTTYVFHANDGEVYRGRAGAFSQAVTAAGKTSRIAGVVYERSGRPAYVLIKVE